jgi:hypothetical protein
MHQVLMLIGQPQVQLQRRMSGLQCPHDRPRCRAVAPVGRRGRGSGGNAAMGGDCRKLGTTKEAPTGRRAVGLPADGLHARLPKW